jgi:hypothetical protein
MSEIRQEISGRYIALGCQRQIELLVRLADRLALSARDAYGEDGVGADGTRLRAFNEAQNRILGQLLKLVISDERRYPDEVFANILVDQFAMLQIDPGEILQSVDRCASGRSSRGQWPLETGADQDDRDSDIHKGLGMVAND